MKKLLALIFVSALYCVSASAQIPTKGDLFFGYSYLSSDFGSGASLFSNGGRTNLNGWNGSLEGKVFPFVGIVADFSGHYGSKNYSGCVSLTCGSLRVTDHMHSVLFGPRVSVPIGKLTPFAHALFGVSHINTTASVPGSSASDSDTSFGEAFGGGLDYRLIRGIGLRFQGDFLQTRFFGGTQDDFRLSTGVVFHF